MRLDRVELLLLLSSALSSLGCVDTVRALRRETGVTSEQRAVERVRAAILAGQWQQAKVKCDKLLRPPNTGNGGEEAAADRAHHQRPMSRQRALVERVTVLLQAGRFLDELHAAIDSQQSPVEALTTLTQHIAALPSEQHGGEDDRRDAEGDDSGSDAAAELDSNKQPASFLELCDRWLPCASRSSSSAAVLPGRLPRLSSLLCVLSSLLLCISREELSLRSGCDVSSLGWRSLLADRIIDCLPRASAVPHNQLANMLAIAAVTASQQQQQQQHSNSHQHSQLQHYMAHPQPAVAENGAMDVSLLATPPQLM